MAILQLLLKEFCNVFLNGLLSKLPLETTITNGIGSNPVSQLAYCFSASELARLRTNWLNISEEDLFDLVFLHGLRPF